MPQLPASLSRALNRALKELSLTGNQPISDMLARKRKWRREGSPEKGKGVQRAGRVAGGEGGAGGDDDVAGVAGDVAGVAGAVLDRTPARYSVYLLYEYKSC
jgi:hypothetical protein